MRRMRKLIVGLCLIGIVFISFPGEAKDINRLWNIDNLEYVKANSSNYAKYIDDCVKRGYQYAAMEPLSVVNKRRTFAPDAHYYCSMSPYYWPVSKNNSIEYVCRDGQSNPEAADFNQWSLSDLATRLQSMALAYFFTGDRIIYSAFVKQLDIWFLDSKTRMYPNFDYSQVIPGKNGDKGTSTGFIEARPLTPIIESICLMNSCRSLGYFRNKRIRRWFSDFLEWMQTSELCKKNYKAANNIGTSYNVTVLRIALFVNSKDLVSSFCESFPERVRSQINDNGIQPLEVSRTAAFSYSTHNLWFIVEFCTIAKSAGYTKVYEESKTLIKSASDYLTQYIGDEESFPHQQIKSFVASEKALLTINACINFLNGGNVIPSNVNNIYDLILYNVHI